MFDYVYKRVTRQALRRGLRDGSRVWVGVGAAALTIRALQRLSSSRPQIVREELRAGETLVIANLPEPS